MREHIFNSNTSNPDETTLVAAKCPNCGGELAVDSTKEAAVCIAVIFLHNQLCRYKFNFLTNIFLADNFHL